MYLIVFGLNRAFALRAGKLLGLDSDIFFLYINELEALLTGDDQALQWLPIRKGNYEKHKQLPPLHQ